MEHESEYDLDKKLDIYNLHLEWQKQSELYGKWSKRSATATKIKFQKEERLKALRTEVKRDVEMVRAEIDFDIRKNWEGYGFDKKPTETAIAGAIIMAVRYEEANEKADEQIKKAVDELADAIEDEEYLKGAVLAMSHKKASIEGEVQLWLGGYFSDPKIPKTLKLEQDKETQKKLRRGLKRT